MSKIDKLYQIKKNGKGYNNNKIKVRDIYERFIKIITLIIIPLLLIVLIYGIGAILNDYSENQVLITMGDVFIKIGKAVFNNLSIIFCLVTVISITNNVKAVAVAVTGFLVFSVTQFALIQYEVNSDGTLYVTSILFFYQGDNLALFLGSTFGIVTLNTSIFGGVIVGVVSSYIYYKCIELRMPKSLGLLNGFPFVSMIVVFASMLLAVLFLLLWIVLAMFLNKIYYWMWSQTARHFLGAALVYEFLNILLVPFGFKDISSNLFVQSNSQLLTQQEFMDLFRQVSYNYGWQYNIFTQSWNHASIQAVWTYLQQPNLLDSKLSLIQWISILPFNRLPQINGIETGLYNWFLYSKNIGDLFQLKLPPNYAIVFGASLGVSVAIVLTSKNENRIPTALLMSVVVLVTILTGNNIIINLFIFLASPLLYFVVYAPIAGLNGLFMSMLGVHIWVSFTDGLIDFIYKGILPAAKGTQFFWIPIFSVIWFVIITPIFAKAIVRFDYPFVGRRETILPRITHKKYHEIWNH
ncbi:PTS transporter subunit EIIC [Spiroplasma sp. SV19]|uniref:PTS transporter subunit EIIC n=1 Tax=Spiroplasma sp. SV19 TaxID=2570468 RepID=UPI0024B6F7B1|nr:PTS transporter subunit EIIC [Spiroplasma sp. SV19]WHQ37485.1 PTS glucose transporter subunit IIABC [Spiroplasma sp. SV19]